jgi:DNA-binding NarL/FixJ family response regulator
MKILIVDDHVLFREGLVSLLSVQPDITIVDEVGTAQEAVEKALELKPDLILMDIGLPDFDGLEATRIILNQLPETKIVILTIYDSDDLLFTSISSGAKGYLLKNTPLVKFLTALRGLERGEAALSRTMTSRILDEFARLAQTRSGDEINLDPLTARERDIIGLLAKNATNREIAEELVISENTVKVHIHNILEKLNLQNRREAALYARQRGMANMPPVSRESRG